MRHASVQEYIYASSHARIRITKYEELSCLGLYIPSNCRCCWIKFRTKLLWLSLNIKQKSKSRHEIFLASCSSSCYRPTVWQVARQGQFTIYGNVVSENRLGQLQNLYNASLNSIFRRVRPTEMFWNLSDKVVNNMLRDLAMQYYWMMAFVNIKFIDIDTLHKHDEKWSNSLHFRYTLIVQLLLVGLCIVTWYTSCRNRIRTVYIVTFMYEDLYLKFFLQRLIWFSGKLDYKFIAPEKKKTHHLNSYIVHLHAMV